MKAMIMAAGFGTRLRPLTDNLPKALVPVVNRPVLERNIEYLNNYGIKDIIINAHYHAYQIQEFISALKIPEVNLTLSLEEEILGTGGGLANCRDFLRGDTFIVINSDILTNINLDTVLKRHRESGDIVTLVLHDYPPFNQIDITNNDKIKVIHKTTAPDRLAFTGIHVLEPDIFEYLPDQGFADIISACYNPLIKSGKSLNTFIAADHHWYDIGTVESYKKANMDFLKLEDMQFAVGKNTLIDPSATLKNRAVIGNNVIIGKDTVIDNSIVWENVIIKDGAEIKDSIVTPESNIIKTSNNFNNH